MLRTSMALADLLHLPLRIEHIRAGRPKPGLASQHATGVRLVAQLSPGSVLTGAQLGSSELTYIPPAAEVTRPTHIVADAVTAGAITLMVQIALPLVALSQAAAAAAAPAPVAPIDIEFRGGTNVSHSPPIDHVQHVLLPLLARTGVRAQVRACACACVCAP